MNCAQKLRFSVLTLTVVCSLGWLFSSGIEVSQHRANTGMANPAVLMASYHNWKTQAMLNGTDQQLNITLGWLKGLSAATYSDAYGHAGFDLNGGRLSLAIDGLPDGEWELWLVHNRPHEGDTTIPEPGDTLIKIATFRSNEGAVRFNAPFDKNVLSDFPVDRVIVVKPRNDLFKDFALTGAPSLFERLQRQQIQKRRQIPETQSALWASFRSLRVTTVDAQGPDPSLVAKGHDLFLNETFNGNGRTCGTCHPERNNFTIDPKFITTLPPNDPLFVAEFNPALANLERPDLMRRFGLIAENVDGFDHPFVMRGVPHTLALSTSIKAPDPTLGVDFTVQPPFQRLGWGGDGAPGGGTLREFAIGAIIQHFTKTLNRIPGIDFRLPSDDELDAMEAFQLSLGRQEDFDLHLLQLNDSLASTGQSLFTQAQLDNGGTKKCMACHFNAGATTASARKINPTDLLCCPLGFNRSGDIGTENDPRVAAANLPLDGGFGRTLLPDGSFGTIGTGIGPIKQFNAPPLVEAADTAPFFHHALRTTIEDAVSFYGTDSFNNSPLATFLGLKITLNQDEISAIASFLRVINALENIRSSVSIEQRAFFSNTSTEAAELIRLAIQETNDALDDLRNGSLIPELTPADNGIAMGVRRLLTAKKLLVNAASVRNTTARNSLLAQAVREQRTARAFLAIPGTLPSSFQN